MYIFVNIQRFVYAGEARSRILHVATELGARELRVPTKQNKKIQRAPDTETEGVLQIPAADAQQSVGEPTEPVLRELPQWILRQKRLHALRPRRRSDRHVPQNEDRQAGQAPQPRRGEQDIDILHADGTLRQFEAQLPRDDTRRDPHKHDREERPAETAGYDQTDATCAAAHGGSAHARLRLPFAVQETEIQRRI